VHNFYVPAGGDEPDRDINPKFAHKLDFIEEMRGMHAESELGDGRSRRFWSAISTSRRWKPMSGRTSSLLKVVSHTPVETENLT
jgi:exodeoxyribonuclease-3